MAVWFCFSMYINEKLISQLFIYKDRLSISLTFCGINMTPGINRLLLWIKNFITRLCSNSR